MRQTSTAGFAGQPDAPYEMEVVAAALTPVAGLVDERADNVNAEPANAALFCGVRQIRGAESEWIELLPVVDETYPQVPCPPPERHSDAYSRRMRPRTMRYCVGEELIENDQKPRPLVIRQTASPRELVGKGLKPGELGVLGTQRDCRPLHRRLFILLQTSLTISCIKKTVINQGGRNWRGGRNWAGRCGWPRHC